MGTGTSSGKNKSTLAAETATPASAFDNYMRMVSSMNTMRGLNNTIEMAANDDKLTNAEYQQIYDAALKKIQNS